MVTTYQVFPITSETFDGIATGETLKTERLVKALDAGTLTVHLTVGTDITLAVIAGMDFYINNDGNMDSVTSTASIMMS